jgi:F0F1-type ATP synthase assembly protein I
MSQPDKPTDNNPAAQYTHNLRIFALGGEIGCLTLFIVVVGLFTGLWLDKLLDSKPVFTLIFILGSAPLALIITFWLAMRTVKQIVPPKSTQAPSRPTTEEDTSE